MCMSIRLIFQNFVSTEVCSHLPREDIQKALIDLLYRGFPCGKDSVLSEPIVRMWFSNIDVILKASITHWLSKLHMSRQLNSSILWLDSLTFTNLQKPLCKLLIRYRQSNLHILLKMKDNHTSLNFSSAMGNNRENLVEVNTQENCETPNGCSLSCVSQQKMNSLKKQ